MMLGKAAVESRYDRSLHKKGPALELPSCFMFSQPCLEDQLSELLGKVAGIKSFFEFFDGSRRLK
jgi:hypothetical protein